MARGVNRVTLIGTLGKDPEMKTTSGGMTITNVNIATNEEWKDKQTGEKKTNTEWHRLVFFGNVANVVNQYLRKGSLIYVEGKLRTSKYIDKSGVEKYTTDIICDQMQMLDKKSDNDAPRATVEPKVKHANDPKDVEPAFDDDVPF